MITLKDRVRLVTGRKIFIVEKIIDGQAECAPAKGGQAVNIRLSDLRKVY